MTTPYQRWKRELALLKDMLYYRLTFDRASERAIIERFHKLYYDSYAFGKAWMSSSWLGVPVHKCPMDLWTYQAIIYELRPDMIIETGTLLGGSACYLASLCDLVGNGQVITIDIESSEESASRQLKPVSKIRPDHPRITYVHGSSTSEQIFRQVKSLLENCEKVLVVLDSDHTKAHVLEELRLYAPFVSIGSYVIVEDTCANGHPILPTYGPGPMEAVAEFLKTHPNFVVDRSRESHLLTFNPGGYLRRMD